MRVTDITYLKGDYPILNMMVDGVWVSLTTMYVRQDLLAEGWLYIGEEFNESFYLWPASPSGQSEPVKLRGWTNDPGVLAAYHQFLADLRSGEFDNKLEKGLR